VTFNLDSGESRMFEVKHSLDDYKLQKGSYTFEIEYPGYGSGERSVTVY